MLDNTRRDRSELARLAGRYRFGPDFYVPNSSLRLTVHEDGSLQVEGMQPEALLLVSDNELIHCQHWLRITVEHDDRGRVTGLTYGHFRATREAES